MIYEDGFTYMTRLDYLQLAYFYAELVLVHMYCTCPGSTYVTQSWYNRMYINALMVAL